MSFLHHFPRLHRARISAWPALLGLAALSLGACADSITQPRDEPARLTVSAAVAGTPIATIVITVSAADIPRPLIFNLTVHDGLATGTLHVPPGPARLFTAQGFDASGEVTHEGAATADIKKGDNPPLAIAMLPRTGQVPITITIGSVNVLVTPAATSLVVGATQQLAAAITYESGHAVPGAVPVWASSNPAVASVDQGGLVTARAVGEAQLMAVFAGSGGASLVSVSAAPPPSVAKIAFTGDRDGTSSEIYVMNPDGSDPTPLNNYGGMPAWSPDRTKIAFVSNRDGNAEIYVMNADGTGQTRLTNDPNYDYHPAWSPDGSKIAFARSRGNTYFQIYVMNADGTGQTRLTDEGMGNSSPTWSPDGKRIAFSSDRGDGWSRIYAMNADGTEVTRLTDNKPAHDADPAWSPDGTRIAFASLLLGSNWALYVMNANGTGQTRLSADTAFDYMPTWSPDGTQIAFTSLRDNKFGIYVMRPDGSGQTCLTTSFRFSSSPAWW